MKYFQKKRLKQIAFFVLLVFCVSNIIIIAHTYKFTHFNSSNSELKKEIGIQELLLGVDLPRPINGKLPTFKYETINFVSNGDNIEAWLIKTEQETSKGTVIMAHGYCSSKSVMLDRANFFLSEGYNVLAIDFIGSGGFYGNQTTIGHKEAENIKDAYQYLIGKEYPNIIIFGTSMGAVAIMKAIHDHTDITPSGLILECPYGSMLHTVKARFRMINKPEWVAYPFTFWGGLINGFNAFELKPIEYAKSIKIPTFLLYGKKDPSITLEESNEIFNNLNCKKYISIYPNTDHDNFLDHDSTLWAKDIRLFIRSLEFD